jgi:hypothetical protein
MSPHREILTPLAFDAPEFQHAAGTADVIIAVNAQQPDYGAPLYSRVVPQQYQPEGRPRDWLVWPADARVLRVPVDIGSGEMLRLERLVLAGQREGRSRAPG